ncbi:MAG: hypothetical protein IPL73_14465 [Candidatus Obscuribacter sp.]|jgi:hypothetical protein|nr:hypothetical protein [Candidatus Obscuribacter sp.]MBK9622026.1 hypothetical protein [Candidatus Obscuribacter sp.]
MKDVILASLIAFVLAALIANNPMPPAKSPLGVGSVNHTVYGTKKPENLYPEIQITDDKRIYHFSEKVTDKHGTNGVDFPRFTVD